MKDRRKERQKEGQNEGRTKRGRKEGRKDGRKEEREEGKMEGREHRKKSGPDWTPRRAGSGPRALCLTPLVYIITLVQCRVWIEGTWRPRRNVIDYRLLFQGEFPSVEDMTVAERALHEMRALIRLMQEEVAKAQEKKKKDQEDEEERRKQVELQAQQEAQKKAAQSAKEKAQRKGERARVWLCYCKNVEHMKSLNGKKSLLQHVRRKISCWAAVKLQKHDF